MYSGTLFRRLAGVFNCCIQGRLDGVFSCCIQEASYFPCRGNVKRALFSNWSIQLLYSED